LTRLQEARDQLERRGDEGTGGPAAPEQRVAREADEHVRAEQALRDSEQRYRMLFLTNPHPMWVYDRQTLGFLAVNQAAIELYGYTVEEFLRMTLRDIRRAYQTPEHVDEMARPRSDLTPAREWRQVCKDGRVIDL